MGRNLGAQVWQQPQATGKNSPPTVLTRVIITSSSTTCRLATLFKSEALTEPHNFPKTARACGVKARGRLGMGWAWGGRGRGALRTHHDHHGFQITQRMTKDERLKTKD